MTVLSLLYDYDCMAVWLYDGMVVWLYGRMIVWSYDCMAVWLYDMQALVELYTLVLGLDVLGNPVNVVKGVVGGTIDLFYEPIKV